MNAKILPSINATLNATSAVLVVIGLILIKRGHERGHIRAMVAAIAVSTVFLASYLTHKFLAGPTAFGHEGEPIRVFYLALLLAHTVLAVVTVPLVAVTAIRGWKRRLEAHKRIARWTVPIWLFVSISGVVVFLMLYGIGSPEAWWHGAAFLK